eukprot:CAMPEP_0173418732 /NCGR_PEP_ID=MMETSP1357-20121228/803_1 /TAXON_ID=77926 /ORGANISM="Hemiselmis rufescens, Strain PCC563" /LENGTH=48 /DNA_ID= /DNA_START= /DNA_END= /DNA_ORIENTATION=
MALGCGGEAVPELPWKTHGGDERFGGRPTGREVSRGSSGKALHRCGKA